MAWNPNLYASGQMIYYVCWHDGTKGLGQTFWEALTTILSPSELRGLKGEEHRSNLSWSTYLTRAIGNQHYECCTVNTIDNQTQLAQVYRAHTPATINLLIQKYGQPNRHKSVIATVAKRSRKAR